MPVDYSCHSNLYLVWLPPWGCSLMFTKKWPLPSGTYSSAWASWPCFTFSPFYVMTMLFYLPLRSTLSDGNDPFSFIVLAIVVLCIQQGLMKYLWIEWTSKGERNSCLLDTIMPGIVQSYICYINSRESILPLGLGENIYQNSKPGIFCFKPWCLPLKEIVSQSL